MKIYMALCGDSLDETINNVSRHNDEAGLRFVLGKIEEGYQIFTSFAEEGGGYKYSESDFSKIYVVDAKSVNQLKKLSSQFHETTGSTVSIGLGLTAEQATLSQLYVKQSGGGRVCPFDPSHQINANEDVNKSEIQEDLMEKAETKTPAERRSLRERFDKLASSPRAQESQGVEPTEQAGPDLAQHYAEQKASEPQSEKQDPKIKEQVVQALMAVKAHAPTIEAIKQQDPELYTVIADIIKSMLIMAKQATGQDLDKSEDEYIDRFIAESLRSK